MFFCHTSAVTRMAVSAETSNHFESQLHLNKMAFPVAPPSGQALVFFCYKELRKAIQQSFLVSIGHHGLGASVATEFQSCLHLLMWLCGLICHLLIPHHSFITMLSSLFLLLCGRCIIQNRSVVWFFVFFVNKCNFYLVTVIFLLVG